MRRSLKKASMKTHPFLHISAAMVFAIVVSSYQLANAQPEATPPESSKTGPSKDAVDDSEPMFYTSENVSHAAECPSGTKQKILKFYNDITGIECLKGETMHGPQVRFGKAYSLGPSKKSGLVKRSEEHYRIGKKHGLSREWRWTDEKYYLYQEVTHVNGSEEGPARLWYENGALQSDGVRKDGRCKVCKSWFPSGKMKSETAKSKRTDYFESGKKKSQGPMHKDGYSQIGKWSHWYSNGNLKSVGSYAKDGSHHKDGKWTTYFKTGQKESEGVYRAASQYGKWTTWYENGNKAAVEFFEASGLETSWHENGTKAHEGKLGKFGYCGVHRCWDAEGEPIPCEFMADDRYCERTEAGAKCTRKCR